MLKGFLLVDKPAGCSSFSVVARVRAIIRAKTGQKIKVGHGGTLDPLATGLLILAVGDYTKKMQAIIGLDKEYIAEAVLGRVSSTGDSEGTIEELSNKKPSNLEVKKALDKFCGEILQTPPIYSAIKVGGVRAYKLSRKGQIPKLEARKVNIKNIKLISCEYPKLKFKTEVSSGTYIRSLVEDIGKELNTGAYMSGLQRTSIGKFDLAEAQKLDDLTYNEIIDRLIILAN